MIEVYVNGKPHTLPDGATIAFVVEHLKLRTDRIATEHNLKVVPKAQYAETKLASGDKLEIVTFVGGG